MIYVVKTEKKVVKSFFVYENALNYCCKKERQNPNRHYSIEEINF